MKTVDQAMSDIIDIGLSNSSKNSWLESKKYLADYVEQVRQDQKEKCLRAVKELPNTLNTHAITNEIKGSR